MPDKKKTPSEEEDVAYPAELARQMTLAEFITELRPHRGLVASFKVEEKDLSPRSQVAWAEAFKAQSERVYK